MIVTGLLLALQVLPRPCPSEDDWLAGRVRDNPTERRETRQRMIATWRAMGLDREAIRVLDAIVVRESSGDRCAVHVLGPGEYGLGPGGLSVKLHLVKWDPDADPAVLHVPEVSAVVMARLLRRFVRRYGARTWLRVGQLYGGRIFTQVPALDRAWCRRLERIGVDCRGEVPPLGKRLGMAPEPGQELFVFKLRARFALKRER